MDFSVLYPIFTSFWGILALIVFFGGSIFIHELGHYMAARKRGLVVKSFSIGFGPRLFGWRKDGIDYKVSLLPLGGYVALPQLADMRQIEDAEGVDVESLPPITYLDKVIVAAAGAVFNIIFALFISLIVWGIGRPVAAAELTTTVGSVMEQIELPSGPVPGPAWTAGIRPGDRIISIDGSPVEKYMDIHLLIMTGSGRGGDDQPRTTIIVDRQGETLEFEVDPVLPVINERSGDRMRMVGIMPASDVIVGAVTPGSPAERAQLQPGDKILAIDGNIVHSLPNISNYLNRHKPEQVVLSIVRDGRNIDLNFEPEVVAHSKPLLRVQLNDATAFELLAADAADKTFSPIDLAAPTDVIIYALNPEIISGARTGDILESIDGVAIISLAQARQLLSQSDGEPRTFTFARNRRQQTVTLDGSVQVSVVPPQTRVMVGFAIAPAEVIIHPTPYAQFHESVTMIGRILHGLSNPSSDIGFRHLSGPIGIGRIIYEFSITDFQRLLWFVVLLNINLAILNLLPIPVLDGGHIAFATIAKLRGKALPQGFINAVQGSFMLLLFGLIFYIIFFDSMRWIGDTELKRSIAHEQIYWLEDPVFGYKEKD